ncbi:hypothetical protein ETD86_37120 [Nonomuraea turkmeniaca]|uniref:Uncharacterized protein n=1 Tax=Nonomuraea turkmeniaca TaxID=103838 RepID=A0A5S4F4T3_9ACTN|nr:hypothetical protein [Nonomuraea turkmeniaca]TMR11068.1 hypothetical protein ETD86_37120 [Nonomuraea turkmeniaca]
MTYVLPQTPRQVDVSMTARYYLDLLHYFGFSLTIHTPRTSSSGEYVVRGSRGFGAEMEIVRGHGPRLFGAILRAAVQMGGMRLEMYRQVVEQRPERDQ